MEGSAAVGIAAALVVVGGGAEGLGLFAVVGAGLVGGGGAEGLLAFVLGEEVGVIETGASAGGPLIAGDVEDAAVVAEIERASVARADRFAVTVHNHPPVLVMVLPIGADQGTAEAP